jgi:ABC-type uncharacterized transport system ATPase subunit
MLKIKPKKKEVVKKENFFMIKDLSIKIPKSKLIFLIGPISAGKTR